MLRSGSLSERPGPGTWREDYLFSIGASSWLIHFGVVALTFVILEVDTDLAWPRAWVAAMAMGTVFLGLISLRYRSQAQGRPAMARRFALAHSMATALIGLCWGTGALAVGWGAPDDLGFYSIVLGGTALGAVSSQHALMRSCLLSIWTSVSALAAAYVLYVPGIRGAGMGVMILLFGVMLTILAARIHRFLATNVALLGQLEQQVKALERARCAADEANAAKSRLLAQASHDLRQPVHAIGLLVECLRQDEPDADRQAIIRRIDRSLGGLSRLFRSLLDVATLDLGRVRPAAAPFRLAPVLADVVRQSEELARENNVTVRLVPTSLCINGDAVLIHTMVQNLLYNAVKYAPGRRVLIGCRRCRRGARIEIHDTGPGIPAEHQEDVFDEFFRLQPGGRAQTEGLGLGLSIVRRLAGLMGIGVSLTSRPEGGTVFRLTDLPAAPEPPDVATAAAAVPAGPRNPLDGFRVTVVDDDPAVRDGMAALLRRWGCAATVRDDPPTALEGTDFLIVDQMLGGSVTGIAAIEALAGGARVPAAIITGAIMPELEDRATAIGVPVLMKPVRPAQLHSLLLAVASNSGAASAAAGS